MLEFGTGRPSRCFRANDRYEYSYCGPGYEGIADFINGQANDGEPGTVAICYDSRINSNDSPILQQVSWLPMASNRMCIPVFSLTRALSFATRYLGCAIGINVTASHNPSKYNGYKVYGPDGCQIASEIADAITQAIGGVDMF